MAIPNYTYLKLKMPGPNGVITVGPSYEHAYECDVECVEHGEAVFESAILAADLDGLANTILDPKRHAGSFEPAEDVKLVPLDPAGPKVLQGLKPRVFDKLNKHGKRWAVELPSVL
jgi:hypothetical protein